MAGGSCDRPEAPPERGQANVTPAWPDGQPARRTADAALRTSRSAGWRTLREADRRAIPNVLTVAALGATVLAVGALILAILALAAHQGRTRTVTTTSPAAAAMPAATPAVPSADVAKGVAFERYRRPDPTLPAVPAGPVKRFRVTVDEHVTKVAPDLAATQIWSFGVNGVAHPGTGVSTPIVVDQGDTVEITLVNRGTHGTRVTMPHSIDLHSAEVAPNVDYTDIAPGATKTFRFVAKHPGVFMYHCATQPILMHDGSGMAGMMVVRPRGLAPAHELWITQQESFLGQAGGPADMSKIAAKTPDVIAFNGYANRYKDHPIAVRRGERIRMYVLNADVSTWWAFHVIGTVFDTTRIEGVIGHDSQTVNLAPSQGGWVEFTLDREGNYPFVTHAFEDMVKGAAGTLHTAAAPAPKPGMSH